jgi:CubicO group peptidase (beta-lactamase class C family)
MEASADRYRYVLEQPIVAVPGERWIYCGGATALIGKILEYGTKQSLHDYAREVLFDPLQPLWSPLQQAILSDWLKRATSPTERNKLESISRIEISSLTT